jgi:hypothetical protein
MRKIVSKLIEPSTFILVGVLARVLPHPANFAPIAAMALFGGTYMGRKQAFVLPILAMVLSDFVIGFDSLPMRLTVYGSFLIMVLIGVWLKKHKNARNVILATLFSSILFFVTTNFSVWAFGTMYPKTLAGLTESYFFAIPFFRNTILGDAVYSGAFFGGYELINTFLREASLQKA